MAGNDDDSLRAEPTGEAQKPKKKGAPVKALVIAVVGVLALYLLFSGGRAPVPQKAAEEEQKADDLAGAFDVGNPTDDFVTQRRRLEVAEVRQELERERKERQESFGELGGKIESLNNKMDERLGEVVKTIEEQSAGRVLENRESVMGGDGAIRLPDANGVPGTGVTPRDGLATEQASPQQRIDPKFPYRRLSAPAAGSGTGAGSERPVSVATLPPVLPGPVTPTPVAEPELKSPGEVVAAALNTGRTRKIYVPAYSFVDAVTLHGVTCPIQTDLLGKIGLGGQQAPVVIPVVGKFRGPQGYQVSVGRIHLLGLCEGVDRKRPTGMVTIEKLSFVKPNGENVNQSVTGYVIDSSDNELGVRGVKESVKGKQVAAAVIASGIAAIGGIVQSSATTSVTSTVTGAITNTLQPGNVARAAGGAFVAEGAEKVAELVDKYGEQLFDTVHIPAGAQLKFINTQPIEFVVPNDPMLVEGTSDGRPVL